MAIPVGFQPTSGRLESPCTVTIPWNQKHTLQQRVAAEGDLRFDTAVSNCGQLVVEIWFAKLDPQTTMHLGKLLGAQEDERVVLPHAWMFKLKLGYCMTSLHRFLRGCQVVVNELKDASKSPGT